MIKYLMCAVMIFGLFFTGCMLTTGSGSCGSPVTGILTGKQVADQNVCSVCGRKFDSSLKTCPYDSAALKLIK
jgi:hypothetical protein